MSRVHLRSLSGVSVDCRTFDGHPEQMSWASDGKSAYERFENRGKTQSRGFRRQKHVNKITVFVDSDFAGDPVARKSTAGLVAQIGDHTVKSGSTLQSLTALCVGEAEFYAMVKGGQVGLSLRSMNSNDDRNTKRQFDGEFFNGSTGSRTANEAH